MATVPSEVSELSFTGDGAVDEFDLSFPILESADLVVWLTLDGSDTEVLQVEGVDYEVSAAPSAGPTVTMTTAPPLDSTLRVERTLLIIQDTNFQTAGPFSPSSHTRELDRGRMIDQQLARRLDVVEGLGAGLVGTLTFGAPVEISDTTESAGSGLETARSNHVHGHGDRGGGSLHAVVVAAGAAGFMSGADKTLLNALTAPRSYVQADNNVAQSIPHDVETTLKFVLEKLDVKGEYSIVTGEFTALEAGVYFAYAQAHINLNGGDNANIALSLVGGTWGVTDSQSGVEANGKLRATGIFRLDPGDKIYATFRHTNSPAAARSLSSDQTKNTFTVARMV